MDLDLIFDAVVLGGMLAFTLALRHYRRKPPKDGEKELQEELDRFLVRTKERHTPKPPGGGAECRPK